MPKSVIGRNVSAEVKGKILTLTIDLEQDLGKSASGLSDLVASTGGNVSIEGVKLGLNVYKPDLEAIAKAQKAKKAAKAKG